MQKLEIELSPGKKIYFASDFHLGAPDHKESRHRENKIVRWLESIEKTSAAIMLVGDVFDFWFEYRHVVPKGFVRFLGKMAELRDKGIPIYMFHGNHDMWMFDYFPTELGIPVYPGTLELTCNDQKILVGHGDGLGPGDNTYKAIKKIFRNKLAQWAFQWVHPNVGMAMAHSWSQKSRAENGVRDDSFREEDEWLWRYSRDIESTQHHDYYVFGHRHLPIEMRINEGATYVNLGEWMHQFSYGVFDGEKFRLEKYEE